MAFQHGRSSDFALDNSGGTPVDLSAYTDDVSFDRDVATAETTTFQTASGARTFITGLQDASFTASGKFDVVVDAQMESLLQAGPRTFTIIYGAATVGAQNPSLSGECILTSYSISDSADDVITWSASFQVTGAVTRAVS